MSSNVDTSIAQLLGEDRILSYPPTTKLKIEARFATLIKAAFDLEVEEFVYPIRRDRGKRTTTGRFKANGKLYQFSQTPEGLTVDEL